MKKLITIALMLVTVSAFSQITIEPKFDWKQDSAYWQTVKTISAIAGNAEANDTVEYIFNKVPDQLNTYRYFIGYEYNNNNTLRWYRMKRFRLAITRSRTGLVQQYVRAESYKQLPDNPNELIYKYLIKAKQLGVKNNNTFWNYPPIDSIVHPEKYITVSDTTIAP